MSLFAPGVGRAQTFKVEKFDIKGEGGTDYVSVEAATGRVFVSRSTHVMVVDGATGKVLGDIPNTPGVHGAGIATKAGHGFTTNGGDQTVTMFDLKTLEVIKQIKVGPGLDGIMYDEPDDKIILTNHSRPIGTLTAIDPASGDIVATVELEDTAPEGAAADGKGRIFVNNEGKNTMQVIDVKTWKAIASWPLAPCEGPTGIAYDKASNRIFSGCSNTSVVVDPSTGKVVAPIKNGTRVDALGWDASKKLIYIPNGGEGNVTVVHQDSPDAYTVVATVPTFAGAKTIAVDPATHNVYLFQPECGPAPPPPPDAPPPAPGRGRGRGPQGPIIAAWFIVIRQ
ncbi:MAG: YVTN family beta-propeller domain-containing protein [Acidobacteria bacterium]|nr:MAG: YVTN family beta-propeller domain-containing protein [Acidobacteriota bacterium]